MVADATEPLPAGDEHGNLSLSVEGTARVGRLTLTTARHRPARNGAATPHQDYPDATIDRLPETVTLRIRRQRPHGAALLQRARAATRHKRPGSPILVNHATPATPAAG
jgi:hypothetical protein